MRTGHYALEEEIPHNLNRLDRGVRLVLGLVLLGLGFSDLAGGRMAMALFLFSWVPIVTAFAGWCPVYSLFGFSSRRR